MVVEVAIPPSGALVHVKSRYAGCSRPLILMVKNGMRVFFGPSPLPASGQSRPGIFAAPDGGQVKRDVVIVGKLAEDTHGDIEVVPCKWQGA